ncbi:hypothetical protein B0H13DRAFT_1871525 [Mycena leptocephala]|nr:hypothetical protein B0H13DRAFT_1871525 [Mycena leptocephala]
MSSPAKTAALTDAQDKAFKEEAMRLDGRAPGPTLQAWIDGYVWALPAKPPGHQTYYERRRAELAAKKARVEVLMDIRRWPRPRCLSKDHERENQKRRMEEEAAREAAKADKAAHEAKEERAVAAHVAALMQMRAAWEASHRKKLSEDLDSFDVALLNIVGVYRLLLTTLTTIRMSSLLLLNCVCHGPWCSPTRPLLGNRADQLRPNSRLTTPHFPGRLFYNFPIAVRGHIRRSRRGSTCAHLGFAPGAPPSGNTNPTARSKPTFYAQIDSLEWARVLPQLKNLRKLSTAHHVPLKEEVIPNITFRLHSFTSFSAVIGPWVTFIAMQMELQELILHSDFLVSAPAPACLPMLRRLKAHYDDIARFSEYGALTDIWVWLGRPNPGPPFPTCAIAKLATCSARLTSLRVNGPQLKMLLHMTPALLHGLQHLVLDEDRLLCGFNQNTFRMVCSHDPFFPRSGIKAQPVPVSMGTYFAREMVAIHQVPSLTTLHFCAVDGCATWWNWGRPDELAPPPFLTNNDLMAEPNAPIGFVDPMVATLIIEIGILMQQRAHLVRQRSRLARGWNENARYNHQIRDLERRLRYSVQLLRLTIYR